MGLRFRDLMTDVGVECMPGGPAPPACACTQTANAPNCGKGSQNPGQAPPKPKPGPRPPKRVEGLDLLRYQLHHQLRSELTSG